MIKNAKLIMQCYFAINLFFVMASAMEGRKEELERKSAKLLEEIKRIDLQTASDDSKVIALKGFVSLIENNYAPACEPALGAANKINLKEEKNEAIKILVLNILGNLVGNVQAYQAHSEAIAASALAASNKIDLKKETNEKVRINKLLILGRLVEKNYAPAYQYALEAADFFKDSQAKDVRKTVLFIIGKIGDKAIKDNLGQLKNSLSHLKEKLQALSGKLGELKGKLGKSSGAKA